MGYGKTVVTAEKRSIGMSLPTCCCGGLALTVQNGESGYCGGYGVGLTSSRLLVREFADTAVDAL